MTFIQLRKIVNLFSIKFGFPTKKYGFPKKNFSSEFTLTKVLTYQLILVLPWKYSLNHHMYLLLQYRIQVHPLLSWSVCQRLHCKGGRWMTKFWKEKIMTIFMTLMLVTTLSWWHYDGFKMVLADHYVADKKFVTNIRHQHLSPTSR